MGRFDGILLVTDLDGTLLRHDKSVSAENLAAIERFKAEGGHFAFVTGRVPQGALAVYEQVSPNAPCGCANGGCVYDFTTREVLWSRELPSEALQIVEEVESVFPAVGIELGTSEKIYFHRKNAAIEQQCIDEQLPNLLCRYRELDKTVVKVLFAESDEAELQRFMAWMTAHPLAHHFTMFRSDKHYFEMLPKGACKGDLVERLSEILGVPTAKIIAVGDNENDVSMLKVAGVGVAVANAYASAKAAADVITVSNEEHAIAQVISDLESGRLVV